MSLNIKFSIMNKNVYEKNEIINRTVFTNIPSIKCQFCFNLPISLFLSFLRVVDLDEI